MKLTAKKLIKMLSQPYAATELENCTCAEPRQSTVMEGIAPFETVALWAVIARLAINSDSSHTQALILDRSLRHSHNGVVALRRIPSHRYSEPAFSHKDSAPDGACGSVGTHNSTARTSNGSGYSRK